MADVGNVSGTAEVNGTSTTVFGFTFDPNDPAVIVQYSLANILITSVIPVPLAGPMTAIACLLFGLFGGMVVNTLTSVVGGYIGLLATRYACRPCFMRALGRYHKRWEALDAALTSQGAQIALLIRLAPVSPMVLTNILLSLTSISQWTYIWTCTIGIVPANLPYGYAAIVGMSLANEFPPRDPVMLTMSIVGFLATIAVAYKIGVVAKRALAKHGLTEGSPASSPMAAATEDGELPAEEMQQGGGGSCCSSTRAAEAEAAAEAAAASHGGGGAAGGGDEGAAHADGIELTPCVDSSSSRGGSGGVKAKGGTLLPGGARRFQHLEEGGGGSRGSARQKPRVDVDDDELSLDDDL